MQDLTVRSESVQRIYNYYTNRKLVVNRRYQRKLVWSIEEKAAFIDSILNAYPVPLILLAEGEQDDDTIYEIIDGMQRLNAIVSFIENEFAVNEEFFDLESMAETKLLKDNKIITQRFPIMDRKVCAEKIASYILPISSYKSNSEEEIDEVFRRINSNGKHLSRQEIRQAGSVSLFAEAVRKIASEIRGDVSLGDKIDLNDMKKISITSKELEYGIVVDGLFWIKNGIIRREQVRESKDEEIIADILAAMLLDEMPSSSSTILDEFYNLHNDTKRSTLLEEKIKVRTSDILRDNFFSVFDEIRLLLETSGKSFIDLISKSKNFDKVPRYFQIVFLAIYKLMVVKNKKARSQYAMLKILDGITDNVSLSKGGGNWSAIERENSINAIMGMLDKCFVENLDDPATIKWSTEMETILKQSEIEQSSFDFKLGLYNMDEKTYNTKVLDKCIKTLTAMANRGKKKIGYIVIGVADNVSDALKLENINAKYKAIKVNDHFVTGINFDIDMSEMTPDRYFQRIVQLIDKQPIDEEYKSYIGNNIKFLKYGDKHVIILKVEGLDKAAIYGDDYYERKGADVQKVEVKNIAVLFDKFK